MRSSCFQAYTYYVSKLRKAAATRVSVDIIKNSGLRTFLLTKVISVWSLKLVYQHVSVSLN